MSVIFSLQILWKTSLLVGKSPSPGHAMKFLSLENFQIPQTLQSSSLGAITFRGHSRALRLDPQEPLASTLHPLVLAVQGFTQYSYASHGATETNAWSQGAKGNVGPGFVRSVECDAGPLQTGGQVAPGNLESEGAKCGTPSPPKREPETTVLGQNGAQILGAKMRPFPLFPLTVVPRKWARFVAQVLASWAILGETIDRCRRPLPPGNGTTSWRGRRPLDRWWCTSIWTRLA